MIRSWLSSRLSLLGGKAARTTTSEAPALATEMARYDQALEALAGDSQALLLALQARDNVEAARTTLQMLSVSQAKRLIRLDEELRQLATRAKLNDLPAWRESLQPPNKAWWWFLDQKAERRDQNRNLPYLVATTLLMLLTATVTVEVVRRLWAAGWDMASVFGGLLTLGIAVSPLLERGHELGSRVLNGVLRIKPHLVQAVFAMALAALVSVSLIRVTLPRLARYRNNQGLAALQAGNLALAQRKFDQAVSINPNLVVPYHNIADVYQSINRLEEAKIWYRKAIERDLNFAPAYQGLGHVHNQEEEYEQAEAVLTAGLERIAGNDDDEIATVIRHRLLSDLGWAYFAQGKRTLALNALEQAVGLEASLEHLEGNSGAQYREAFPHCYLAELYEQLERPTDAYTQYEECLRLLKPGWESETWRMTAAEHLENLETGEP